MSIFGLTDNEFEKSVALSLIQIQAHQLAFEQLFFLHITSGNEFSDQARKLREQYDEMVSNNIDTLLEAFKSKQSE